MLGFFFLLYLGFLLKRRILFMLERRILREVDWTSLEINATKLLLDVLLRRILLLNYLVLLSLDPALGSHLGS